MYNFTVFRFDILRKVKNENINLIVFLLRFVAKPTSKEIFPLWNKCVKLLSFTASYACIFKMKDQTRTWVQRPKAKGLVQWSWSAGREGREMSGMIGSVMEAWKGIPYTLL